MSRSTSQFGPGNALYWTMHSYKAASAALPHPNETWIARDQEDVLADQIQLFDARGIIKFVERNEHSRHVWRTNPGVWDYVQEFREEATWTPCGHTGVRNLGDGDYTCTCDSCDETFDRDTAEQVISG